MKLAIGLVIGLVIGLCVGVMFADEIHRALPGEKFKAIKMDGLK